MYTCSREYALVMNIRNTADNHKNSCDTNCNISLSSLREAAILIGNLAPAHEITMIAACIKDWPF